MPRPRSKDPLTAATTAILLPFVREHGFSRKGNRAFLRRYDCMLHYFDLQRSGYGGGDFCVNYAVIPLCNLQEFFPLSHGARLTAHHDRSDQWWAAHSHSAADNSILEVTRLLRHVALRFFDEWGTPGAFAQSLQAACHQHHDYLDLGTVQAWLGRTDAARKSLRHAAHLYEVDFTQSKACGVDLDWIHDYRARTQQLVQALDSGEATELLMRWTSQSLSRLAPHLA